VFFHLSFRNTFVVVGVVFTMTANVFQLGEVAEIEAQMFSFS